MANVPGTNVPAPESPIDSNGLIDAPKVGVEEALDAATTSPESEKPEAPAAVVAPAKVAAILDKKDAGQKLTKTEEKQLKEFKLKVNGRERSFKVDLSNDAELQKHFQKAAASDEAFNQAAEVRKAALAFMDDLKKNPRRVLQDPNIGIDLHKFAEEIMNDRISDMQKSPEQKDREAKEQQILELKRQLDQQNKSSEQREQDRMRAEHERSLETEISAALDIGGLPKTPRTVASMAEMMGIALKYGVELSPQEIAPIVKKMRTDEFQELLSDLADDQLEDFIGKQVMGRLRKRNVAKAKAPQSASQVKSVGSDVKKAEVKEEPRKKMTYRDFLKA